MMSAPAPFRNPPFLHRVLALVTASALITFFAPAAQAIESPLEFSRDGRTWQSAPPAALFETSPVLVPGTSADATLHLRSVAEEPGVLEAALTGVRITGEDAAQHLGVAGSVTTGGPVDSASVVDLYGSLPRTPMADLEDSTSLGPALRLAPGEEAMLHLSIDLDAQTDRMQAQDITVDLALNLTFRDARADDGTAPDGTSPDGTSPDGTAPGEVAEGGGAPTEGGGSTTPPGTTIPLTPSASGTPAGPGASERSDAASTSPATGAEPPLPAGGAGADDQDAAGVSRGILAVTGASVRTLLVLLAAALAGAALLFVVRRRQEES